MTNSTTTATAAPIENHDYPILLVTVAGGGRIVQSTDFTEGAPIANVSVNVEAHGQMFLACGPLYAGDVLPNLLDRPQVLLLGGGMNAGGVYHYDAMALVATGARALEG